MFLPPAALFRAMGPVASAVGARSLFLDSPRKRGKNRPKAFPLGEPPTSGVNSINSSARLAAYLRTARYRLACRRYRSVRRFVPTLGGAYEDATAGTPCRSYPKRGGNCPIAAHEVKRRPHTFCRALDGVMCFVTRAGFQRARPFGHSCLLLVRQK